MLKGGGEKSKSGAVETYHQKEIAGDIAYAAGNLPTAIARYTEALEGRKNEANKLGHEDDGHLGWRIKLQQKVVSAKKQLAAIREMKNGPIGVNGPAPAAPQAAPVNQWLSGSHLPQPALKPQEFPSLGASCGTGARPNFQAPQPASVWGKPKDK